MVQHVCCDIWSKSYKVVGVRMGDGVCWRLDPRQRYLNGKDVYSLFTVKCYTLENTDR